MHAEEAYVVQGLQAGAKGYLATAGLKKDLPAATAATSAESLSSNTRTSGARRTTCRVASMPFKRAG